jgi:tetrapyrrole methylase family protein/MazG family protein
MDINEFGDLGTFQVLEKVVAHLLGPDGCPWDREQTHQSLKRNLLEECYEVIEAIDSGDPNKLVEELGDILVQVAFHIQLAVEEGSFGARNVFTTINQKLIRRHPHVFGGTEVRTAEEVKANWEAVKQQERGNDSSRLGEIPKALPALANSQLIQDRAAIAGFYWDSAERTKEKIEEELEELEEAQTQEEKEWELGDVLIAVVNRGRWMGLQAEDSLRRANDRFHRRFTCMEGLCKERGLDLSAISMNEKLALWQEAKSRVG